MQMASRAKINSPPLKALMSAMHQVLLTYLEKIMITVYFIEYIMFGRFFLATNLVQIFLKIAETLLLINDA